MQYTILRQSHAESSPSGSYDTRETIETFDAESLDEAMNVVGPQYGVWTGDDAVIDTDDGHILPLMSGSSESYYLAW